MSDNIPQMNASQMSPSTISRNQLTRYQRVAAKSLYNSGHAQVFVSQYLDITYKQINVLINNDSLSPRCQGR